jgi:hypothetical protein
MVHEDDYSDPSSAKVKNSWTYISSAPKLSQHAQEQPYLYKHDKSFTLISGQFIILYMPSLVSATFLIFLIKIKAEKDMPKFSQDTWPWNLIHVSIKAMHA